MTDTKNQNKGVNPVAAGVAGAIIGVGAAVVATVALKDKKTQKKVKDVLHTVADQAKEYIGKVKTKTGVQQEKVDKKLEEGEKQITKVAASVKESKEKHDSK